MKNIYHVVTNQKSVGEKRPVFHTEESKRLSNNVLLSRRLFLSDLLLKKKNKIVCPKVSKVNVT